MQIKHFTITQSMLITILAAGGTLVATLVPAWGPESKIIVGALGTFITVTFPLVNGQHAKADAERSKGAAIAQSGFTALHVVPAPPVRAADAAGAECCDDSGHRSGCDQSGFGDAANAGCSGRPASSVNFIDWACQVRAPAPRSFGSGGLFSFCIGLLWKFARLDRGLTELAAEAMLRWGFFTSRPQGK